MIVRRMVEQFALPVEIIGAETIRAADGLALSSRNGYLSTDERREAPELYKVLHEIKKSVASSSSINNAMIQEIEHTAHQKLLERGWQPDYLSVRLQQNLLTPNQEQLNKQDPLVILAAAKLGKTRLIDNLEI